jgi:hypothetical protein
LCARFLRLYECTSPNGKAQLFMRKRDQTCEISLISLRSLAKARIRERDDDEKSESQKREREINIIFSTRYIFSFCDAHILSPPLCDQRFVLETITTKRATQTSLSRLVAASLYQRIYTFPAQVCTCVRDSERAHAVAL